MTSFVSSHVVTQQYRMCFTLDGGQLASLNRLRRQLMADELVLSPSGVPPICLIFTLEMDT